MESVIKPKKPKSNTWQFCGNPPHGSILGYEAYVYYYPNQSLQVISAVEVVSDPNDIDKGPEYHVSISKNGGRCTSNEAMFVLSEFDMLPAEEDNHTPGGHVRHFWMPVADNLIGYECPCKESEPVIKEDKGDYIWRGLPHK